MARTYATSLELVHAWSVYDELDEYALLRTGALDEWRQKREAKLASAVATLKSQGIVATGRLLEGEADRAIAAFTKDHRTDLLVIGTEGRRGIAHALLGSVAERIVRTLDVPVMAVPRAWPVGEHDRFAPKSILVPVDLEPASTDVVELARSIARKDQARLTIAFAWDATLLELEGPAASSTATQMQSRFARWVEIHAPKVDAILRRGAAFDVIEALVGEREIDLIVMATAGRTGVEHFMLGSVTERALRSLERPILVQRRKRA
jgi:nucleotide-binding universal stress UspA family protein